jgi:hypothetical protein
VPFHDFHLLSFGLDTQEFTGEKVYHHNDDAEERNQCNPSIRVVFPPFQAHFLTATGTTVGLPHKSIVFAVCMATGLASMWYHRADRPPHHPATKGGQVLRPTNERRPFRLTVAWYLIYFTSFIFITLLLV